MSNNENVTTTYTPSARKPLRFEHLRPGSFFRIVDERSRNIRKSSDMRIYQKAFDGFYAEHPVTKEACVLFPQDMVMPMRKVSRHESKSIRK